MNSVPQDSPKDFSMALNSPLVGNIPVSDFADTSELFSFSDGLMSDDHMLNDSMFTFPNVNFDPVTYEVANSDPEVGGVMALDNFDNVDAALFMNEYTNPLMDLQTISYLYPQSTSNEQQNLPPDPAPDIQPGVTAKASRLSLPKPKKPRVARSSKGKPKKSVDSSIHMPVPLSRLYPNIPLEDVVAWICRPTEIRQVEWTNRRDYTKMPRPVNAFILYRKATSERAKRYGSVGNHQFISKITGASWRVESHEIKDRFNQFAELEKRYHAMAFPSYKYSPNQSSRTQRPVKSKTKAKVQAKVPARATTIVVDSDDGDDDKLSAVLCPPDLRLCQARLESSLKRVRKESPQSVSSSSTTESSFGRRSVLFARDSVKATRNDIRFSTRQLDQQFSQYIRVKKEQVNCAEDSDSDSEDDESVRATKRRRFPATH